MKAMRAAIALAALASMAACSGRDEVRGEPIACTLGLSGEPEEGCRVELVTDSKPVLLVIHHPDGGFRRLALSGDGKALVAADGADPAISAVKGDSIEVAVGQDRYRIPLKLLEPADDR
jgi:hypothetical protein